MSDGIERAIRERRTHKAFRPEPVPRQALEQLLELARWVPNHRLTQPWRFRVLGPASLARLQAAADEAEATKLERAPTLVLATCLLAGEPVQDEEDLLATAAAVYAVLLGAHARGLASYWRTPALLRSATGRAALGLAENEHVVSLIHLGPPVNQPPAREEKRHAVDAYVQFLD